MGVDDSVTGRQNKMLFFIAVVTAVGVLTTGAIFYGWLMRMNTPEALELWGARGDSIAPFAALLNYSTLIALLLSLWLQRQSLEKQQESLAVQQDELRLQRKELRLQRQELSDSREVMKEQKAQFERTAKAQEDLAASQERLAKQQEEANERQWFMETAQRRAALASLYGVIAQVDVARARFRNTPFDGYLSSDLISNVRNLAGLRVEEETFRLDFLEKAKGIHRSSPGGIRPEEGSNV